MGLRIPGAPRVVAGRPAPVGPGHTRKIGLIGGSAGSLASAPWIDPSWSFWAHASVAGLIPHQRADRLFDPHPSNVFTMERKNGFKNYYLFLQHCPTPIYMQEHYQAIPQSVRYPREMVAEAWPDVPVGSTTAWMIALALLEGVTHLGLWGIDYSHKTEYAEQRANTEHWVGIARGMGVQVVIPKASPLCHEPRLLYGYESHTPELFAERIAKIAAFKEEHGPKGGAFSADRLAPIQTVEDARAADRLIRLKDPDWAREVAKFNEVEPPWLPRIGVPTEG